MAIDAELEEVILDLDNKIVSIEEAQKVACSKLENYRIDNYDQVQELKTMMKEFIEEERFKSRQFSLIGPVSIGKFYTYVAVLFVIAVFAIFYLLKL